MASGGCWLPKDSAVLEAYVNWLMKETYGTEDHEEAAKIKKERGDCISPWLPPVKALKDRIATDAKFNLYFNSMFNEVPWEYMKTMKAKSCDMMLRMVNHILTMPPMYTEHHVGCPINAIFTWPMGTVSGYAAFLDNDVNQYITKSRLLTLSDLNRKTTASRSCSQTTLSLSSLSEALFTRVFSVISTTIVGTVQWMVKSSSPIS